MENEYVRRAHEIRKRVSTLSLKQQKELLNLYEGVIENFANDIGRVKSKTLTERWLKDRQKAFMLAKVKLSKDIEKQIKESLSKSSILGTQVNKQMMMDVFRVVGIDPGNHFTTAFSNIQDEVIKDILTGDLYRDHSTLSKRIWNFTDKSGKDLQYLLQKGILEGKSALELAKDVEDFVKDPAKRPWSWSKVYPNLRNTKIDYNAQRLSRTMINHSYQTASIKSSQLNPFVEGIEWRSALINHRTCKICISRHGKIFAIEDVPLDHPNGLCTMLPHVPKSLDEVGNELKDWLDGDNNPTLDDWYDKHGQYFSGIKNNDSKINSSIIRKEKQKFDPKVEKLLAFANKTTGYISNRRKIAKDLLFELNLSHMKISIKKGNAYGYVTSYTRADGLHDMVEYSLKSDDPRSPKHQLKTIYHEAYHAKAHGLKNDRARDAIGYLQIEETFAETSAHFIMKQIDPELELAPSYAERLIEMLPRLKKIDKFKDCSTFADFGQIAWTNRLNGVAPEWYNLYHQAVVGVKHDWTEYIGQYMDYIDTNKEELIDVVLKNMPQYEKYKADFLNDFINGKNNLANGKSLNGNQNMVISNMFAVALNRVGVK